MRQYWNRWGRSRLLWSVLLSAGVELWQTMPSLAQNITHDGSLGPTQTLIGPVYFIQQADGLTVGRNLFHSFGRFNLDTGEVAIFDSNGGVRNILSRVTGGAPSVIDGLLFTSSATVNFFFMNPSGIIFGPNASLDVGTASRGSFIATTMDAIAFSNGTLFSSRNFSQDSRLLTVVGDPSGFLAAQRPGAITSTGSVLVVPSGQSLLLVGGDITLNDTRLLVRFPDGGRVELGSVAAPGAVGLTSQENELRLVVPPDVPRGDISITNNSLLDVAAADRGSLAITARNLTLSNSRVFAGIAANLGGPDSQAGNLALDATGVIQIDQGAQIRNNVDANAQGNSGDISVRAESLLLLGGALLSSSTFGQGNAGNVDVRAERVQIEGQAADGSASGIFSSVENTASGNAGSIQIQTQSLAVLNGAVLSSSTFGRGNAGNIAIEANSVVFAGERLTGEASGAFSNVSTFDSVGNAGNIRIAAQSLAVLEGATLGSSTFGRGNAGNIDLQADTIVFSGVKSDGFASSAFSSVARENSVGNAGNIQVRSRSLSLLHGAILSSSTFGQGNAGAISVNASDVLIAGTAPSGDASSSIASEVALGAVGNGNQITIQAERLVLSNGGNLSTSTFGLGRSGNIIVQASDAVTINDIPTLIGSSGIFSTNNQGSLGDGGDITIDAGSVSLFDGAAINAGVFGQGNSGNITIRARDRLLFDGGDEQGFATGVATAIDFIGVGNGGDLSLEARSIIFSNGGLVEATSFGRGNAGNVFVTAFDELVVQGTRPINGQSGGLFTSTFGAGDGGNVIVNAPTIQVLDGAVLDARTYGSGRGGNLIVNTNQLNIDTGGQLIAVTQGTGAAGNITVNAKNQVTIAGFDPTYGDRLAQFERYEQNPDSPNRISDFGGTLDSVAPNSGLFVRSQQTGEAGNITVNTPTLRLSDRATLNAETASGNGGNINLNIPDLLLLRRNSTISATAGTAQAGGNGGNITINTGFIVGVQAENSDIVANAFTGRGGNIQITAQGVFGLQFRPQLTPQSDITASSTFGLSGLVTINTPNVDPNRGLVPLLTRLEDASRLMTQTCAPRGSQAASSFVATGRGGLPASPLEPLQSESVVSGWVERPQVEGNPQETEANAAVSRSIAPTPWVEAGAWIRDDRGTVYLVAAAASPPAPAIAPRLCP